LKKKAPVSVKNPTVFRSVLYLLLAVISLGVLVAGAALGSGYLLPSEYAFKRTVLISQPPEVVWQAIADFARQPEWRENVVAMEQLPDHDEREAWRATDRAGQATTMVIVEAAPREKLVSLFLDAHGAPEITWQMDLTKVGRATQVDLHQSSGIPQPWLRAVKRFFPGTSYADMYLRSLAKKFGDPPIVQ
jgi:uncharacterized protein YndB with AHSA1/START domain